MTHPCPGQVCTRAPDESPSDQILSPGFSRGWAVIPIGLLDGRRGGEFPMVYPARSDTHWTSAPWISRHRDRILCERPDGQRDEHHDEECCPDGNCEDQIAGKHGE